ncbi:hypothetical protein GCM10010407_02940 [Rarobacter incanus]
MREAADSDGWERAGICLRHTNIVAPSAQGNAGTGRGFQGWDGRRAGCAMTAWRKTVTVVSARARALRP